MPAQFRPQWASPPGRTIRDSIVERGIRVDEFARDVGLAKPEAESLLAGELPISISLARALSRTIGGSVEFWIARDCHYRDDTARLSAEAWMRNLPATHMRRMGWVTSAAVGDALLPSALEFFGVRNLDEWRLRYPPMLAATQFRASEVGATTEESVAAWLRRGQIQAAEVATKRWNATNFAVAVKHARKLSRDRDPQIALTRLTELFAAAGVAVALVRAPEGCPVSGATATTEAGVRCIILSGRYLSDDHLWFTVMHEAGHVLLHSPTGIFIDSLDQDSPSTEDVEVEANQFAMQTLLPPEYMDLLPTHVRTARDVLRVSSAAGVSPGVVVGQLQHTGRIGFENLNTLKRRYRWNGPELTAK